MKEEVTIDFDLNTDEMLVEVERLVQEEDMDYIEATVHYCDVNGFDIESLAEEIPSSLRSKLEESARQKRMLKPKYNNISVLPV